MVKNIPANAGEARDAGSIPGRGRSLGEVHNNLLQFSCLENPTDKGAWRATVYCIAELNMTEATCHVWQRKDHSFLQSRLAPVTSLTSQQIRSSFSLPDSQIQFPYPKPGYIQHAIPELGWDFQVPVVVSLIQTECLFKGMLIFIILKRVLKLLNVKHLFNERMDK